MGMVVNSVAYRRGRKVGDVTLDDISEVLKEEDSFVWLGLHEPDHDMLKKVQEEFSLHELAIEDALKAHQRPKIEEYGASLFIALKTAQLGDDSVSYGETQLFVGKQFMVSVRHGPSSGYSTVRERCEKMPDMMRRGPGFALYALLDFVVDNYQPVVTHFEKTFEQLEAGMISGTYKHSLITRLYELKRELMILRGIMQPLTDICHECMRFHEDIVPRELRVYFRDIQDHVTRLTGTVDSLREMLSTALQVNLALVAVKQNEVVKSLAGWGAILAIPTVLFSWFGMNFRHMPELEWPVSYPLLLGLTALLCVLLHRRLKKSGWV
jgi:magnesium transporter